MLTSCPLVNLNLTSGPQRRTWDSPNLFVSLPNVATRNKSLFSVFSPLLMSLVGVLKRGVKASLVRATESQIGRSKLDDNLDDDLLMARGKA